MRRIILVALTLCLGCVTMEPSPEEARLARGHDEVAQLVSSLEEAYARDDVKAQRPLEERLGRLGEEGGDVGYYMYRCGDNPYVRPCDSALHDRYIALLHAKEGQEEKRWLDAADRDLAAGQPSEAAKAVQGAEHSAENLGGYNDPAPLAMRRTDLFSRVQQACLDEPRRRIEALLAKGDLAGALREGYRQTCARNIGLDINRHNLVSTRRALTEAERADLALRIARASATPDDPCASIAALVAAEKNARGFEPQAIEEAQVAQLAPMLSACGEAARTDLLDPTHRERGVARAQLSVEARKLQWGIGKQEVYARLAQTLLDAGYRDDAAAFSGAGGVNIQTQAEVDRATRRALLPRLAQLEDGEHPAIGAMVHQMIEDEGGGLLPTEVEVVKRWWHPDALLGVARIGCVYGSGVVKVGGLDCLGTRTISHTSSGGSASSTTEHVVTYMDHGVIQNVHVRETTGGGGGGGAVTTQEVDHSQEYSSGDTAIFFIGSIRREVKLSRNVWRSDERDQLLAEANAAMTREREQLVREFLTAAPTEKDPARAAELWAKAYLLTPGGNVEARRAVQAWLRVRAKAAFNAVLPEAPPKQ